MRRQIAADVPRYNSHHEAIVEAERRRDAWESGLGPIERWVCITERFQRFSRELLLQHGFHEWMRFGGRLGNDGRPTLGKGSMPAREILTEVISQLGHFSYLDRYGWVRAVFITGDTGGQRGQWHGLSLGGPHSGFLFSRSARAAAGPWRSVLVPAGGDSSAFRFVDRTYDSNRTGYAPKRGEVFELASRLVPLLWQAADQQNSGRVKLEVNHLAEILWSSSPMGWPNDCTNLIVGGLDIIAGLLLQSMTFYKCGWCPRVESSRPTILHWRAKVNRQLQVHLSREFREFGNSWAAMMAGRADRVTSGIAPGD
ncbi:MAG: hypothetical protein AB7O68_09550 [Pirellulales bacterium]